MKNTITLILSIIWVLLAGMLLLEPTSDLSFTLPWWAGWAYLILLFGLPIVIFRLIRQN